MKRTSTLLILALVSAALLPLAAAGKIPLPHKPAAESDQTTYKYEGYIGYGYSSLNQVNQSRYGVQGVEMSITRDWGKYFGFTADGATYDYSLKSVPANTPTASVDAVLMGPVVHANLIGKTSGFFHILLGGEHTVGQNQSPKVSYADGWGCGLDYKVSPHIFIRAAGDRITSAFSVDQPVAGDSPHKRKNARATIGVVFKF